MSVRTVDRPSSMTSNSPPDIPSVAPWDDHNQKWVSYVHPSNWKNPTSDGKYNLLVIGAGVGPVTVGPGATEAASRD